VRVVREVPATAQEELLEVVLFLATYPLLVAVAVVLGFKNRVVLAVLVVVAVIAM
jgi:hypothetical protein